MNKLISYYLSQSYNSMGQILKPVCLCPYVRLRALLRSLFLIDFFYQNWH